MAETNGYQRRLYTSMDIGQAVDELVYHRVPSHVTTIGLVLTKQPLTGWRLKPPALAPRTKPTPS